MNASAKDFSEFDNEMPIRFEFRSTNSSKPKSTNRQSFGRRRGKAPQQFNGIHRRRNKKIAW